MLEVLDCTIISALFWPAVEGACRPIHRSPKYMIQRDEKRLHASHWRAHMYPSTDNFPTHGQLSAAQGNLTSCLNFDFAILNLFEPSAL
jgi:hypothetical protein